MAEAQQDPRSRQRQQASAGDATIRMDSLPVQAPSAAADDELEQMALQLARQSEQPGQTAQAGQTGQTRPTQRPPMETMAIPRAREQKPSGSRPIVIKGGPRRVVRADGRAPKLDTPTAQDRFELSSGHAMFQRPRRMSHLLAGIIGLVCIGLAIATFAGAWMYSNYSLRLRSMNAAVSNTLYNYSLSLTPAVDGGYYTTFFVTSTSTTDLELGELAHIYSYRTVERPDRDSFTKPVMISIPINLAVSTSASGTSSTAAVSQIIHDVGINRALTGIDRSFNIRQYNVVVIDQAHFDQLLAIINGTSSADDFDVNSLLGHVRSNLSLQGIVDYCAKVGAVSAGGITSFEAPTNPVTSSSGEALVAGSAAQFASALSNVLQGISTTSSVDALGNPWGTQYDENGNPILDEAGNPWGTQYDENGNPIYDENGNLVIVL